MRGGGRGEQERRGRSHRTMSEDGRWGTGLGRGGKGAAGEGQCKERREIGQRPQLLCDFRFGFQREKVGAKGVSLGGQGVQSLWEGLGRGVSGLLGSRASPSRPRPAQQPPAPNSSGPAAWRTWAKQEAASFIPVLGRRKLRVPRSLPLKGVWGHRTAWLPALITLVPARPG